MIGQALYYAAAVCGGTGGGLLGARLVDAVRARVQRGRRRSDDAESTRAG